MPQSAESRKFFDTVAPEWETLRQRMFGAPLLDALLAALRLEGDATVLEVGSGAGFVTAGLLARGVRVHAVEPSGPMRAELGKRLGSEERLTIADGDAEALALPDRSVDRATGNMFLHHVERPERALRELWRVLRPGGILAFADLDEHGHEAVREAHHDRWMGFPRERVAQMMRGAGFEAVRVEAAPEGCSSSGCGGETIGIFIASRRKPGK